jgi:hypothetical protein
VHGQHDIEEEESWEDFGWTAGATAAAAPYQQRQQQRSGEWSQDDWETNVDAAANANAANYYEERNGPNGYEHPGMRIAATGHNRHADHGNQHQRINNCGMMTFGDWTQDEWEDLDLPMLQPDPEREESPISAHSSLPLLESVPVPSPSSSPQPLQLQYIPEGDAGPTYALQVGPSLHLQPVQQRLALVHQLRNVLI